MITAIYTKEKAGLKFWAAFDSAWPYLDCLIENITNHLEDRPGRNEVRFKYFTDNAWKKQTKL